MLDSYDSFSDTLAFEAEMWYGDKINILIKDLEEVILNLEEEIFKEEASRQRLIINDKEQSKNKENINKDIIKLQQIVEKIESIKNRRLK